MEYTMTEKAIKAGITKEDGEFVRDLMPLLLLGALGVPVEVPDANIQRMLGLVDKLVAVDPDAVPEHMKAMVERLRARTTPPTAP